MALLVRRGRRSERPDALVRRRQPDGCGGPRRARGPVRGAVRRCGERCGCHAAHRHHHRAALERDERQFDGDGGDRPAGDGVGCLGDARRVRLDNGRAAYDRAGDGGERRRDRRDGGERSGCRERDRYRWWTVRVQRQRRARRSTGVGCRRTARLRAVRCGGRRG